MILEANRTFRAMINIVWENAVSCIAENRDVVVNDHTVLESRKAGGGFEFPVLEPRGVEDDVINLPLAGFARGID